MRERSKQPLVEGDGACNALSPVDACVVKLVAPVCRLQPLRRPCRDGVGKRRDALADQGSRRRAKGLLVLPPVGRAVGEHAQGVAGEGVWRVEAHELGAEKARENR